MFIFGILSKYTLYSSAADKMLQQDGNITCMCALHVVYMCYSKSQQLLVSPRSLIPVIRQLDTCQSEAVVGSSSDVTSPSHSHQVFNDVNSRCSPTSSPEADSRVSVRRPAPRGLVDALSRYFTPSDKRRSRVSLNTLPHASPKTFTSDSQSPTSAADTTHVDEALLPTLLPPKRRHHKRMINLSESNKHSLWKHGSTAVPSNDSSVDIQPSSCNSPTSELSPSTYMPSELSKSEEVSKPVKLETSSGELTDSEQRLDTIVAETVVEESMKKSGDTKPRKRRQTQLSSLHDSLSHFFSADGERKRTPAQYVESDFLFETYQHFNSQTKSSKQRHLAAKSTSHAADTVEVMESSVAALWPVTYNRLSNYHLSGITYMCLSVIITHAPCPFMVSFLVCYNGSCWRW